MLVLSLIHVSSRFSGFVVASPCLWGKLQNLSLLKVSKQVVASPWGKAARPLSLEGFKTGRTAVSCGRPHASPRVKSLSV